MGEIKKKEKLRFLSKRTVFNSKNQDLCKKEASVYLSN